MLNRDLILNYVSQRVYNEPLMKRGREINKSINLWGVFWIQVYDTVSTLNEKLNVAITKFNNYLDSVGQNHFKNTHVDVHFNPNTSSYQIEINMFLISC